MTNSGIPITNGVGKRDLFLVMVFCHPNQAMMEACDTLSALHQCNSSEPSVVLVWRYSNTPYIPQGTIYLIHLDVSTFSWDVNSVQFPLDRLCLHQLLLLAGLRYFYQAKWGKRGWRCTPVSQSSYGKVWRRNIIFPIPSPCQIPHWLLLCNWLRALRLRKGQTVIPLVPKWRRSGYHQSFKCQQGNNEVRAQLEYELIQEAQGLAKRYECKWAKQAWRQARRWAQLLDQQMPPFRRCFFAGKFNLGCQITALVCHCGCASPLHKQMGGCSTATQLVEGIPSMSEPCPTESEPEPCGLPPPVLP